jgi:hypothetical protein
MVFSSHTINGSSSSTSEQHDKFCVENYQITKGVKEVTRMHHKRTNTRSLSNL